MYLQYFLIALRFLWNIFAPVTLVFVSINDFMTNGISDCIKISIW